MEYWFQCLGKVGEVYYVTLAGEVGVHFPDLKKIWKVDPAVLTQVTISLRSGLTANRRFDVSHL